MKLIATLKLFILKLVFGFKNFGLLMGKVEISLQKQRRITRKESYVFLIFNVHNL